MEIPVSEVDWKGLAANRLVVLHQLCHNLCLFVAHQQVIVFRRHVNGKEVVWEFAQADGTQVLKTQ